MCCLCLYNIHEGKFAHPNPFSVVNIYNITTLNLLSNLIEVKNIIHVHFVSVISIHVQHSKMFVTCFKIKFKKKITKHTDNILTIKFEM